MDSRHRSQFEAEDFIPAEYNRDITDEPPEKTPKDKQQIMTVLKEQTVFVKLQDREILESLTKFFVERRIEDNETIVKEGEFVDHFFIIREGHIDEVSSEAENKVINSFFNKGCFMEQALLLQIKARSSFIARSAGSVWLLSRRDYFTVVERLRLERRKALTRVIRRIPLFNQMHPLLKVRLRECMTIKLYRASSMIYDASDKLTGMYILLKGSVRLYPCDSFGEALSKVPPTDLIPGQYFGQTALTNGPEVRSGEMAEALKDSVVAFLDYHVFEAQLGPVSSILGLNRMSRCKKISDLLAQARLQL